MEGKLAYIAEYRSKLDEENVLVIHVGSNDDYISKAEIKVVMDGKEVPYTMVKRDTIRAKFYYKPINLYFSCEYQFLIPVTDNFKRVRFTMAFPGCEGAPTAGMTVSGNKFRAFNKKIAGFVDSVDVKDDEITVSGWAADSKPVDVQVLYQNKPLDCEITRSYRKDIRDFYLTGENEASHGYEIKITDKTVDSIKVVCTTEDKKTVHKVNLKEEGSGKISRVIDNITRVWEYNRQYGVKMMLHKVQNKITGNNVYDYDKWIRKRQPNEEELKVQRSTSFDIEPVFSIIVPVFKPDEKFFNAMVESVLNQTYSKWELCLADGGNTMEPTLKKYAQSDKRIKYVSLTENLGISGNTNAALELATGDYIVLGDHDDLLRPDALFECVKVINENPGVDVIYSDEDKFDCAKNKRIEPNFKPDFNLDFLRSGNYICHLFVFSKELSQKVGPFISEYDGAQDLDMILRCCEKANQIVHIPKILYSWRIHSNSTAGNPANKMYAYEAGRKAVKAHLERNGIKGEVFINEDVLGTYRVKYDVIGNPKISILIPNKDHTDDLDICLNSIIGKQDYNNYEIIIIENNSVEKETFEYYKRIEATHKCVKVIYWDKEFNYSEINNFGAKEATGEYLLLLNNDTKMLKEDCLRELVSYGTRPEVGIVGAKLLYEDNTVQHAGIIIGFGGLAAHSFVDNEEEDGGYQLRASLPQDLSAVTAACLLTRRSVFEEVNGLEPSLKVAFNDVDYCLKVREKDYLVVYNPYAVLHHYESKSRGNDDTYDKMVRFESEIEYMRDKWKDILENGDPYYNVNLTLSKSDFSLKE